MSYRRGVTSTEIIPIMTYRIRANKYPNNEIRLTMTREVVRKPSESESSDNCTEIKDGSDCVLSVETERCENSAPSLDISSEFKRPGYGALGKRTQFGLNARRTLLRAGGAADAEAPDRSEWVFLTGTQPSGTMESFRTLAAWSGYLVNNLKAWLNWRVKSPLSFYVWEFQKRGALHLHYAVHIPDKKARRYVIENFKDEWMRLLDSIQEKSGVDMWQRANGSYHNHRWGVLQAYAQTVRKSVAAYLAGYCSDRSNKHRNDGKFDYYPSRWWGVSRPLNEALRRHSIEIYQEGLSFNAARMRMSDMRMKLEDTSAKVRYYVHKVGVGETVVSYSHPEQVEQDWSKLWIHSQAFKAVGSGQSGRSLVREFLRIYPNICSSLSPCCSTQQTVLDSTYAHLVCLTQQSSWVLNSLVISQLARLCSAVTQESLVHPYYRWIHSMFSTAMTSWIVGLQRLSLLESAKIGSLPLSTLPRYSSYRARLRRTPRNCRCGKHANPSLSRLGRKIRRVLGGVSFRKNVFPSRRRPVARVAIQLPLPLKNA